MSEPLTSNHLRSAICALPSCPPRPAPSAERAAPTYKYVPRHLSDLHIVEITLSCMLRRCDEVLGTLYGSAITRHLTQTFDARMRPHEWSALVGIDAINASGASAGALQALERSDALMASDVEQLGVALQTTLVPKRCSQAWQVASTRCASTLAARMIDPKEALEAIFGTLTRVDVRRLGTVTDQIEADEEGSDAFILSTCLAVRALSKYIVDVA